MTRGSHAIGPPAAPAHSGWLPRTAWPALSVAGIALLICGRWSRAAPLVVFEDSLLVGAIIASAAGWGAVPARRLVPDLHGCSRFCVATGLGLAIIVTATLAFGAIGVMNAALAWSLLGTGGVIGLIDLVRNAERLQPALDRLGRPTIGRLAIEAVLLLPLAVLGGTMLYCVTLPPGFLWPEEGNGYDVLEYHLQVPREYFEAGRISFLPHNVYASFPQQVEILYYLLMHIAGGPYAAAIPAQLLHGSLGVMAVLTLAGALPRGWGRVTAVVGLASVPWLPYVGCLAYVELGTLYFAMLAATLLFAGPAAPDISPGRVFAAGLAAGCAGGCKYTAIVLVAAGAGFALLAASRRAFAARGRQAVLFGFGVLLALSPWLIRNAAFTGNPVYPFAYAAFGGTAWSREQDQQWARGHRANDGAADSPNRLTIAARETIYSRLFGTAVFCIAIAGMSVARDRYTLAIGIWLLVGVGAWIGMTHMPARFLFPLLAPLMLAAGRGLGRWDPKPLGIAAAVLATAGAAWNARALLAMKNDVEASHLRRTNVPLAALVDETARVAAEIEPLNPLVAKNKSGKLWIVGQAAVFYVTVPMHYAVVFNRDPWVQLVESGAGPKRAVEWLQDSGVSHLVLCPREIERLRRTYGFSPAITPQFVASLVAAGLEPVKMPDESARSLYDVFLVPQGSSARSRPSAQASIDSDPTGATQP